MQSSRERVHLALNHITPDRVPLDLGGSVVSGMHVCSVYKLRQALELDPPGTAVKVIEPYQMLGEIKPDLLAALGADVVPLGSAKTLFGYKNEGWRPWSFFDGTPLLVAEGFNTEAQANGDILMYPKGDRSVPPSGRMPTGGYYFDSIARQGPVSDDSLDAADNLEEFGPVPDADLAYIEKEARRLYDNTDKAILANFGGTGFGDIALVPAPWLKHTKGIRDVEEWYISTISRPDYVKAIFDRQCEIALQNLPKLYGAVGERAAILFVSGTDFGMQTGSFISPQMYCDLYQPYQSRINKWVHENTSWKTFIHTCGSVRVLLPHLIDAGFDILNPVQCSAAGMQAAELKRDFGHSIVFWGGGVDTQKTLPFGKPAEVRKEVAARMRILGKGGGYIFGAIHNVQAGVPVENLTAFFGEARMRSTYSAEVAG